MTQQEAFGGPWTAEVAHQAAVHNADLQPEFFPHLIPPLDAHGGRADDRGAADAVTEHQLLADQPAFYGLAQPHIVRDWLIAPWHLSGPRQRVELVVLYSDA